MDASLSEAGHPAATELASRLRAWVQSMGLQPSPTQPLLVAYSGGADSTALLHVASQCWPAAVQAVHINHGLQAAAEGFEHHCRSVCAQWGLPFRVEHPAVQPERGDSVEAVARHHRYASLVKVARVTRAAAVCLAHHADDQLETLILALSRGAGVAGLAAMPDRWREGEVDFGRPWLAVRGALLKAHVTQQGLPFVDDPTNAELRFTRNRIRQRVLPVLIDAFPALAETAARSAAHCAQAARLLTERALEDLVLVGDPPALQALQTLSTDRLVNVLRHWLNGQAAKSPSTAQMMQLVQQVQAARTRGHRIDLRVAQGRVQRKEDGLHYVSDP